ncbi:membrane protein [Aureimonas sp. SA4125]|uniref:ceramidase domain-containing protein n=1 Tax=Aureimonas sp. SA4125 TaxID=2826993 RepID=UPI001CC67BB0|nr:ceramidase domain-containing protein [Aureimonas sp. SA4125]BDA86968.1 membrane protein [Aureimonas sp. SA4125]
MNWTDPIDGYCERLTASFWAEPVNAVSNLAFLVAAGLGLALWRRIDRHGRGARQARDWASLALVGVVAVIGVGSFLFHTFANLWSSLADVLPIAVFIYAYFALALYRLVGLGAITAALGTLCFIGLSRFAGDVFGGIVGSSASYVPALLALFAIGLALLARRKPEGPLVLAAGLVFTLSLALRIADAPLCPTWPVGTHFLWHVLNAVTLGLLLVAAIRHGPRRRPRRITA